MRRHQAGRLAILAGLGGLAVVVAAVSRTYLDQQRPTSGPVTTPANMSPAGGGALAAIPDFATLVHESDLVVVGRVLGEGITREEVQPVRTPIPFQPDPSRPAPPTRPSGPDSGPRNPTGIVIVTTRYPVEIERVGLGSTNAGARIAVVQSGGGGTSEDDPLMRAGEPYVLFLHGVPDGSFAVVGGPQGRLSVTSDGRVRPVRLGPATVGHDGQPLDDFLVDVAAVR
jgi:hypothetical protein